MVKQANIEITPAFSAAMAALEDSHTHCFLTGKAGTGKTTLLRHFIATTRKSAAVLAPTGIAAINVGGQTIHSYFRFRTDITPEKAARAAKRMIKEGDADLYRKTDAIVVDEVSMLRADLADCMDIFLRTVRNRKTDAFGGVKMIFVGDLYQLPPVVKSAEREIFRTHYKGPYFFASAAVRAMDLKMLELEKVYRQSDASFIGILNRIRNNSPTDDDLHTLNARLVADGGNWEKDAHLAVRLTATNDLATRLNADALARLAGKLHQFHAFIRGDFDRGSYPTDEVLELKPGAQVMMLNNDTLGRWVNGTMAQVTVAHDDEVRVRLENGSEEDVAPFTWQIIRFGVDAKSGKLSTEKAGSFVQYPMRLAWAVTIHKSQGKTFDRVLLDLERGTFAPGQLYVALSRCRSLEGLGLTRPIKKGHVMVDWTVVRYMTRHRYDASEKAMSLPEKIRRITEAIDAEQAIEVVYLKSSDEKSRRILRPIAVGDMEYAGRIFPGLRAWCESRNEERTFRVDRILEMNVVGE